MSVWTLLVMYQLKHFLADYPLQGRYMLGKFLDHGWVGPLAAHVGVHAVFTAGIAVAAGHPEMAFPLALFDATIHFIMDRLKAGKKYLGRWKPLTAEGYRIAVGDGDTVKLRGNMLFWWCLGIDQMVHHLTHYVCIFFLL